MSRWFLNACSASAGSGPALRSSLPVDHEGCWRPVGALLALLLLSTLGGCSAPPRPQASTISIEGLEYARCFDEVLLVAREAGMPPLLRDRAGGLVETSPRLSGSLFEPWRQDNADFNEVLANTIGLQRRRARFEFVPAGFSPPPEDPSDALTGPALPGSTDDEVRDLRTFEGPIELRVWVFVERSFRPGMQNPAWTRSMTTFATNPLDTGRAASPDALADQSNWTPVRRDRAYEARLIDAFIRRIDPGRSS